jgi:hypothetical protein
MPEKISLREEYAGIISDPTVVPAAPPSDKATDGKDKWRLDRAGRALAEFEGWKRRKLCEPRGHVPGIIGN